MNLKENLLATLSEEAGEICLHTGKAQRFGSNDGYPGSKTTNAQDIVIEIEQLNAVYEMLVEEGVLPSLSAKEIKKIRLNKKEKVKDYQDYSRAKGCLVD